jgi:hypothetical protein
MYEIVDSIEKVRRKILELFPFKIRAGTKPLCID